MPLILTVVVTQNEFSDLNFLLWNCDRYVQLQRFAKIAKKIVGTGSGPP